VKLLEDYLSDSTRLRRFNMTLLAAFAGLALVLASVGIYGVISFSVSQRINEIGIRLALGATGGDVLRMIMKHTLLLASVGIAIGLSMALLLTRLMTSLLFGITATDFSTFAGVQAATPLKQTQHRKNLCQEPGIEIGRDQFLRGFDLSRKQRARSDRTGTAKKRQNHRTPLFICQMAELDRGQRIHHVETYLFPLRLDDDGVKWQIETSLFPQQRRAVAISAEE